MTPPNALRLGFFATGSDLVALEAAASGGIKSVRLIGRSGTQIAVTPNTGDRIVLDDIDCLVHLLGGPAAALAASGASDPLLAARLAVLFAVEIPVAQQMSWAPGRPYLDRPSAILPGYNRSEIVVDRALSFVREDVQDEMEVALEAASEKKGQRWPAYASAEFVSEVMRHKAPNEGEIALMVDFLMAVVKRFDTAIFAESAPSGAQIRFHDGQVRLSHGEAQVTLTTAEVVYLVGGFERFTRWIQVTTDVVMRRIHDNPAAGRSAFDGEILSDMLHLGREAKQYAATEAHWRRNGATLALALDTGLADAVVVVADEVLVTAVAVEAPKAKAPRKKAAPKVVVTAEKAAPKVAPKRASRAKKVVEVTAESA